MEQGRGCFDAQGLFPAFADLVSVFEATLHKLVHLLLPVPEFDALLNESVIDLPILTLDFIGIIDALFPESIRGRVVAKGEFGMDVKVATPFKNLFK